MKLIQWVYIISGAYLIVDGAVSILFFGNQPSFYHIPRFLRGLVGAWLVVKGIWESKE